MPCTFKGTEPSPKGLGHCAHMTRAGTIMRGKDGNLWKVKLDVNGRKAWRRITLSEKKKRLRRIAVKKHIPKRYYFAREYTQADLKSSGYVTLAEYLKRFPKREHKYRREIYMDIPIIYLKK